MARKPKQLNKPPAQARDTSTQGKSASGRLDDVATGQEAPRDQFNTLAPPVMGASVAGWHEHEPFLHCVYKYWLAQVWGIHKPTVSTPDPLAVGGLFHAGRAHWFHHGFAHGPDYWRACQEYIEDTALRYKLPVREEAITRTKSYISQYIDYWVNRPRPKVIGVEYPLSAGIPGLVKPRTARLDDVSEYPEAGFKLALGELKTTSVSIKDCAQEYELHGQPMKQDLLWRLSPEGADKHGPAQFVLLDIVQKGYGKESCQFGRVAVRIYDWARQWYQANLERTIGIASQLTKDTRPVGIPRNITSCTRLIGRMRVDCQFKQLCRQGPSAAPAYVDGEGNSLVKYANPKYQGVKPW